MSGNRAIAEVKILKPGTLDLEVGNVVWRQIPGAKKKDYNCTDGCKLELLAEGKSVFKMSGDQMLIQSADENLKIK